jgi:hypothetical protein
LPVLPGTAEEVTLHFSVPDTGIGIPPEKETGLTRPSLIPPAKDFPFVIELLIMLAADQKDQPSTGARQICGMKSCGRLHLI